MTSKNAYYTNNINTHNTIASSTMRLLEIKTIKHISELGAFYLTEEAVNSSWIADLSYDEDTGSVIMTTLSGSEYEIPEVPYEEFEQWVSAPSKGKHWWSDIKGIYT